MAIMRVIATADEARARAASKKGVRGIALYNAGNSKFGGVGHYLPDQVRRNLPTPPSQLAWDFLSVALAVFGADRIVPRWQAEDGWTRIIALEVDVSDPKLWTAQSEHLSRTLRFLSGDIWYLSFRNGGTAPPSFEAKLSDRDCASLFSGGLDSLIGAGDLLASERRPILVSQASRLEAKAQRYLVDRLGVAGHRFEGRVVEHSPWGYEPSTRARSLLFIGYGVMVASTLPGMKGHELFIPENGLISINPPMSRRRIGSLSTRTTHPYFISSIQQLLDALGLRVCLVTPYRMKTKGEMLEGTNHPGVLKHASASYSCGKGQRINGHCGRCLPCMIRRAAFHHAGVPDNTEYEYANLLKHAQFDDVFTIRSAVEESKHRNLGLWAAEAGPLPTDPNERAGCISVVKRGTSELRDFIGTFKWP